MKKLMSLLLGLSLTAVAFSQDAIDRYLPESSQRLAKNFSEYLVYTLNYVKSHAGDDWSENNVDRLSRQASQKYFWTDAKKSSVFVAQRNENRNWNLIQFKDFVKTQNGSREYKRLLKQISDAIYNNEDSSKVFISKLENVVSSRLLSRLNPKERAFIYNEVAVLYYTARALSINNYVSSGGNQTHKDASWFDRYLIWYGKTVTPKCVVGSLGGAIGGALGGAAAGAPVAGVGAIAGAVIGTVAGMATAAAASCFD